MSRAQILLFCAASLLLTLGVAALLYPYAARSEADWEYAHTPQPMEALPDVDLGPDYGPVPVIELVGFYLENPPQPAAGGESPRREQHFGGC